MSAEVFDHDPAAIAAAVRMHARTEGTPEHRMATALSAYLFAVDGATHGPDGTHYPSPEDTDAYIAFLHSYEQREADTAT